MRGDIGFGFSPILCVTGTKRRSYMLKKDICMTTMYIYFQLGIPPGQPRGHPYIEVTFKIDANGIADITALDKGIRGKQLKGRYLF